eukprot:CAMPEP_0206362776 /NCGR_PEP_ID=MMETSP0294-20121207/1187_1 /ASSEMBLY_ACC=CAM_ASM_000327 /TAXON_ID=39354 /ORGANISM="Heterosigma akashiwo, Strain CCMP2393" /LENGTH=36 /DNA_ID= /DNA_START= /DNA_END= /DNA_ORIENTATION=
MPEEGHGTLRGVVRGAVAAPAAHRGGDAPPGAVRAG